MNEKYKTCISKPARLNNVAVIILWELEESMNWKVLNFTDLLLTLNVFDTRNSHFYQQTSHTFPIFCFGGF